MANQKNNSSNLNKHFINLAFEEAKKNLGKTKNNPSVGCILVKNNSVISSACTSINGRPHAESNALKIKKNFKNSTLYVTLEPCTHYGLTPPCSNLIIKKGVKKVYYAFNDKDLRTANRLKTFLSKKNISTKKIFSTKNSNFYQSYFNLHKTEIPFLDAKIAISKDYLTISRKKKWITNAKSRQCTHLIRSQYDSILSTSKTINKDNALLNCRINGMKQDKPDLIIIDLNLKLKKNLKLFDLKKTRKILLVTSTKNDKKISYFKKKGVKFIFINSLVNKNDFINLMKLIKKNNYNRTLFETGLTFLNTALKYNLISNLYVFRSTRNLNKFGYNYSTNKYIKNLKLINKIKTNLDGESLYKIKIKNV